MQSKKWEEDLESSKRVVKDLEKKLSAKNKSLESMTLSCQNSQSSVRKLKDEKDMLEKNVTKLECALERKDEELKELKIENRAHQDAMKAVANLDKTTIGDSVVDNEMFTQIENLKSQLQSAKSINEELKLSHNKTLNQKNAEIRNLKNVVKVLEEDVKNANGERDELRVKLETSKVEMSRAQNITDLLVEKQSKMSKTTNSPVEKPGKMDGNPFPSIAKKAGREDYEDEIATCVEKLRRNQSTGRNSVNNRLCELANGTVEKQVSCLTLFMEGYCENPKCERLHDINLRKVRRGICVYEFSDSGSCPYGARCMYTHDIPPEILKDPKVVSELAEKMREIKERKKPKQQQKLKEQETPSVPKKDDPSTRDDRWKRSNDVSKKGVQNNVSEKRSFRTAPNRKGWKDSVDKFRGTGDRQQFGKESTYSRHLKEDVDVDGDTHKTVNSFLQLIRPMLMNQVEVSVKSCMEGQTNVLLDAVKNMMVDQLPLGLV